jgi:hypothetical protein
MVATYSTRPDDEAAIDRVALERLRIAGDTGRG